MNFIKEIRKIGQPKDEKQRLLLELSDNEVRMEIYHHKELSSRKLHLEKSLQGDGAEAYTAELTRVLRSEFLWKVEDKAELVVFLPQDWCYIDQLTLPFLDKREIHRTIEWELEQGVPWPRNNYCYDYILVDKVENTYLFGAASKMLIDKLLKVGEELRITVIAITTDISVDSYLTGKPYLNLLPLKNKKMLRYPRKKRAAEIILALAAVVALVTAGGSWGWCWWNEENVSRLQNDLKKMAVWEERMNWVESTQRRIQHIQHIMEQLHKNKQYFLPQLELWSKTAGPDCWLESVELGRSGGELILRGKGLDSASVTNFVSELSDCGFYKRVELVEVKNGADGSNGCACFAVHLLLKEV